MKGWWPDLVHAFLPAENFASYSFPISAVSCWISPSSPRLTGTGDAGQGTLESTYSPHGSRVAAQQPGSRASVTQAFVSNYLKRRRTCQPWTLPKQRLGCSERIQRKGSWAVERKLKLCPIVMTPWGVQRKGYNCKGGDPGAPGIWGSRVWPSGTCSHQERGQSAVALRRGLATHWLRLRYWEQAGGSSERAKTQVKVSRGRAAQQNPWKEASASNKSVLNAQHCPCRVSTMLDRLSWAKIIVQIM